MAGIPRRRAAGCGLHLPIGPERAVEPGRAQHGVEAQQPARRHRRHPLAARGAGQRHFGCCDRLGEIVRGDADRALGQRDLERAPHLPRHPRVVHRRAGPGAFVEPAEDDEIGLLQPRLDQPPDCQPRVAPVGRADHGAGGQRLEQGRVVTTGQHREILRGVDQLMAKAGRRVAGRFAPQPRAAGSRHRSPPNRSAASICAAARRASGTAAGREQVRQCAKAGFEPVGKAAQPGIGADGGSETGKAGRRARAQDRRFEHPGQLAKRSRGEPAGGQRMLQRRQHRHRRQPARGQLEDQAQEHAGRGAIQWQTGRIVDLDAPAAQFGRDPAGEPAVGGDRARRSRQAFRAGAAAAGRRSAPPRARQRNRSG